eukprot:5428243-Pyramimonas_sp.AAC.1
MYVRVPPLGPFMGPCWGPLGRSHVFAGQPLKAVQSGTSHAQKSQKPCKTDSLRVVLVGASLAQKSQSPGQRTATENDADWRELRTEVSKALLSREPLTEVRIGRAQHR